MEWIFWLSLGIVFVIMANVIKGASRTGAARLNNRIPSSVQCEGSKTDILNAVQTALTNAPVCGNTWRINERIDMHGRLQAVCELPLGNGSFRHTLLLNMSVAPSNPGHCSVEWSFVPMAPMGYNATGLHLLENEMYVHTSMRIRAALLDLESFAGGDAIDDAPAEAPVSAQLALPKEPAYDEVVASVPEPEELAITAPAVVPSPIEILGSDAPAVVPSPIEILGSDAPAVVPSPIEMAGYTSGISDYEQSSSATGSAGRSCPGCGRDWDDSFPFCIYCSYRPT